LIKEVSMRLSIAIMLMLVFSPPVAHAEPAQTVVLDVRNMSCAVCPITVRKALERVPGVIRAKVEYREGSATVTYDPGVASPAQIAEATGSAGFPSTVRE
jgi:periplasmic mercuric ion binding protein